MSDDEKIKAMSEKIKVLQNIVGMQTIAVLNIWGVVKAQNVNNKSEQVQQWLKESEDKIKELSEQFVSLVDG